MVVVVEGGGVCVCVGVNVWGVWGWEPHNKCWGSVVRKNGQKADSQQPDNKRGGGGRGSVEGTR